MVPLVMGQSPDQVDQALGIVLDSELPTPFFRQIADQVTQRIQSGALPPGTRLPPSRALATALDTHRNTVVRAFEELAREGLISGHVGRGSFVRDRSQRLRWSEVPMREVPMGVAEPRAIYGADRDDDQIDFHPRGESRRAAGGSGEGAGGEIDFNGNMPWPSLLSRAVESEPLLRMQRLAAGGVRADVINLSRMQASLDLLPHEDFRRCLDAVMKSLGPEALGYAPGQGLERLRALIASELGRAGIETTADDILITTGSQQALDLVARSLVNPGDVFLVEGRTYSGALNILTACGAEVVGVPGDDEGPDLAALRVLTRRRPKGLYLMPSSRNPTGTSISEARRQGITEWSKASGVPIIEDDYGADLELEPGTSLLSLRARNPDVFHVSTYSKKLIPALRVGFIVCPPPMRGPLTRLKHAMDLGTSTLLQHALAEFIERGLLRSHLERVRKAYRERRDALAGALAEALPREITFQRPDRGVVLWLSLPQGIDPELVYETARAEGVLVSPGSVYTAMSPSPAGLRLTYCAEPPERLVEGARRLGRALEKVLARQGSAGRVELMGA